MLKIYKEIDLTFLDYPEDDWAIIVYFIGCELNCKNCHNEELKDWNYNLKSTLYLNFKTLDFYLEKKTKENCTRNVVFSGGDPLYIKNLNDLRVFLELYGHKYNICIYTGQELEDVKKYNLTNFKYLKCGSYDINLSQESKKINGHITLSSKNQRFYNSNYETLK